MFLILFYKHGNPGRETVNDFLLHIMKSTMNIELETKSDSYTPRVINNTNLQLQDSPAIEY